MCKVVERLKSRDCSKLLLIREWRYVMKNKESAFKQMENGSPGNYMAENSQFEGDDDMCQAKLVGPTAVGFFQKVEHLYLFNMIF